MKIIKNTFIIMITAFFLVTNFLGYRIKNVKAETVNPSLSIVSHNISYDDYIYLLVAVGTNDFDKSAYSVKLLFWNSEQSEYTVSNAEYQSYSKGSKTINGQSCEIFYSNGIAAKNMADEIYFRAYVEIENKIYYSEVSKYSVVQYVNDRINSGNSSEKQINLYNAMLNYGNAAKALLVNSVSLANTKSISLNNTVNYSLNPSLSVVSYNVSYSECLYLLVAVGTNNIDKNTYPVKLLFWDSKQTEYTVSNAKYQSVSQGTKTINGQSCEIFYSDGIAAKKMADEIYFRAYVEVDGTIYYSDVATYNVVQYAKDRLTNSNCQELQANLYSAMIKYGAAAQNLFSYNTLNLADSDFVNVSIEDGIFANGISKSLYPVDSNISVTANTYDDMRFEYWEDEDGNIVSYNEKIDITTNEDVNLKAEYSHVIDLTLDTKNIKVSVNSDSSWLSATVKNSNDLVYIIVTISITDENYQNDLYTLIVNDKEISDSKFSVSNNIITYIIEDPNWSDYI